MSYRPTIAAACLGLALLLIPGLCFASDSRHILQYDQPASRWTDALPLGNGRLGCMVFGDAKKARIQFNEDTLWLGGPHSYANVGAVEHLGELRQLLFDGRQREAERLAMREFMSVPLRQCSYQPFGDLFLEFSGKGKPQSYSRSLDLQSATTTTSFKLDGIGYTRRVIASNPAQAIIVQIECDTAGALNFSASLTSPQSGAKVAATDSSQLLLSGQLADYKTREGVPVKSEVRYAARLRVSTSQGKVAVSEDKLKVTGATKATLVLTAATNHVSFKDLSGDPEARSADAMAAVTDDWTALHSEHIADHRQLYDRIDLRIGKPSREWKSTEERILANQETPDAELATLLFNYGRYLMIASSRPGTQPATLQGIWNDSLAPPWDSKYTVNINTEMNYWLCDPCNLPECAEPLFDALKGVAESGHVTAREQYGAQGWVLHHNFDLWRGTAPINHSNHGIWPTGGAWFCLHLWERYLYSGDEEFLRDTAYPLMKGSSEFFADYLIEDPRSEEKWLISGPSNSPEQGGLVMGPTMDHQIIRALFANTAAAAEELGIDTEFRERLLALHARIQPNQIGKHGQLQEWIEDKDDPKNKHRHVSHLWGLHPGNEITPDSPDLFAAARQTLEHRGNEGTGWSRAWKINFWARLRDGEQAYDVMQKLLTLTGSKLTKYRGGGVYPNLFDAHPPFQIDGNFGATNGICEMLVQSHRKTADGRRIIELLPALPPAWSEGQISGIRTRSGFEIDLRWKDNKVVSCNVKSMLGAPALLKFGEEQVALDLVAGSSKTVK